MAQLNSVLLSNGPTAKNNNSVIKQIGKKDKLVVTPMTSFRPNIVVKGANSFDEDDWKKIKIVNQNDNKNHPEFHVVKPCSRCQIPNVFPSIFFLSISLLYFGFSFLVDKSG